MDPLHMVRRRQLSKEKRQTQTGLRNRELDVSRTSQGQAVLSKRWPRSIQGEDRSIWASVQVSMARITVSAMEEQLPGVSDRVVKILGTAPQILQALTMMLTDLGDNQHYQRLSTTPVSPPVLVSIYPALPVSE